MTDYYQVLIFRLRGWGRGISKKESASTIWRTKGYKRTFVILFQNVGKIGQNQCNWRAL